MLAIKSNIDAKYICEADKTQGKCDENTISLVSTKLHKLLAKHEITNVQDLEPKAIIDFISELSQDISQGGLTKIASDILNPRLIVELTNKDRLQHFHDSLIDGLGEFIIEQAHIFIRESLISFFDTKFQSAHPKIAESSENESNERDSDQSNAADDIKRRSID